MAGSSSATSTPMIAITTNSSTRVNAREDVLIDGLLAVSSHVYTAERAEQARELRKCRRIIEKRAQGARANDRRERLRLGEAALAAQLQKEQPMSCSMSASHEYPNKNATPPRVRRRWRRRIATTSSPRPGSAAPKCRRADRLRRNGSTSHP